MILSRVRLVAQARYDLEDFIAQQSGARTDAKYFTREFFSNQNYILKGFNVSGLGLKEATLNLTNATLINANGSFDFSWYSVEDGTTSLVVSDAELQDGQRNYLELELFTETNTPVTKALWDPSANGGQGAEFNQEIDSITDIAVRVVISTGGFSGSADRIKLAIVDVDGSGNITGILDRRDLFFRLATGADADNEFTWAGKIDPEITITIGSPTDTYVVGETITFSSGATAICTVGGTTSIKINLLDSDSLSSGDTVVGSNSGASGTLLTFLESFTGADKDIGDIKEALNALMTEIKKIKGTRLWFEDSSGSIEGAYNNVNSQLVSNTLTAAWSWSGTELSLTDDNGTPVDADVLAKLLILGTNQNLQLTRQDSASSTISLADGEVLFIKVPTSGDRVYSGVGSLDTNYQVVAVEDFDRADGNYWLAVRSGTRLYVRGYGEFEAGESAQVGDPVSQQTLAYIGATDEADGDPNYSSTNYLTQGENLTSGLSTLDSAVSGTATNINQDRNTKLIGGGTWSWNQTSGALTLSASAYLQVAGITKESNEISAQTITLANPDEVAYVSVKRTNGASILAVTVADEASVVLDNNIQVIARRVGNDVLIGKSFQLKDGEFLELDGALAEINRYFGQLRLIPHESNAKRVRVTGADVNKLSGSKIRLSLRNLLLSFDGAVIDFSTGEIFESDGTTPFLAGANDFTPATIGSTEYFWYSVNLLASAVGANNEISGQLLVLPASSSNAVLDNAPKASFANGVSLGEVYVQEDGAGNIEDITYNNIIQLGVGGSGSGGTGDANELLERLKNRFNASTYEYLTPVIYSSTEDDLVDPSSTAQFSIVNSNFQFENIGDELVSVQLLDDEFLNPTDEAGNPIDPVPLNKIELIHYWNLNALDTAATYEVSRDGGNEWQAITMSRIGQSDTYRGIHNFAVEAANSYSQTIGGAQSGTSVFDNSNEFSRIFTLANTSTIRKVTANITKTGSPSGYIYAVVVKDDGLGSPSTDLADEITRSNFVSIDSLVTGSVEFNLEFTQIAEDYHIVFKTDDLYKASYDAGVDEIAIDNDGSGIIYDIEGIELDLRVRITSGTDEVASEGFGIFYKPEELVTPTDNILRHIEKFVGDVDNEDTFNLSFLPDPRLLMVFEIETGQVYRYGAFVLNGNQVIFEPNTFNKPSTVTLEFLQVNGTSFDNSDANIALLAANHLGSTDANIDLSSAGRGIFLRRPDGTLRELTIDDDDNIQIWSI